MVILSPENHKKNNSKKGNNRKQDSRIFSLIILKQSRSEAMMVLRIVKKGYLSAAGIVNLLVILTMMISP
jgi:hypothetical protein